MTSVTSAHLLDEWNGLATEPEIEHDAGDDDYGDGAP
jgi:hypothetical protein